MTLTWDTFRTQIRRSILKDTDKNTWDDTVLLDLCGWALDTFCAHTAQATSIDYTPAQTLAIPANLYGDLETEAILYYWKTGFKATVVQPAAGLTFSNLSAPSYSVWDEVLTLNANPPPTDHTMTLRYFAYYDKPTNDASVLGIPRWSYNAVAHLIGALGETSTAVQSAGIDRFKDRRTDAGSPEDNALRVQQQWMFKVYEQELARQPRQDRSGITRKYLLT